VRPRRQSNAEGLGIGLPKTEFNTLSAATEFVEQHLGRTRMHCVVPIESPKRIEYAIYVVDAFIINLDRVAIVDRNFDSRR
jgi:hypothetical protein